MKISLRAIVGALLLAGIGSASAAGIPLSVELKAQTSKASPGESVLWQITNRSDEAVYVLRWETPLDGLSRSIFEVSYKGQPVRYMDQVVHWGHPQADDFVKIAPGQTLSAEVNLAASYEMTNAGDYTIGFDGQLTYMMATDEKSGHVEDLGATQLDADAIQLHSLGRSPAYYQSIGAVTGPMNFTKAAAYANCTSTRQSQIASAHTQAKTYATNSLNYMNTGSAGTRYTTWFGSYTSTRYASVKSHYTKISAALNNSTVTYNCSCAPANASAFAYVYPSQPYKIYLCNAFWSAA
ncbi:MAG TPA: M35 family metallo-endopeptidase, partial [Xanthomonadales bacterium]|nr:M35 family metallo-endopeptidase [Xanthomonadales bacterium]